MLSWICGILLLSLFSSSISIPKAPLDVFQIVLLLVSFLFLFSQNKKKPSLPMGLLLPSFYSFFGGFSYFVLLIWIWRWFVWLKKNNSGFFYFCVLELILGFEIIGSLIIFFWRNWVTRLIFEQTLFLGVSSFVFSTWFCGFQSWFFEFF
jgi:hypothetical protein